MSHRKLLPAPPKGPAHHNEGYSRQVASSMVLSSWRQKTDNTRVMGDRLNPFLHDLESFNISDREGLSDDQMDTILNLVSAIRSYKRSSIDAAEAWSQLYGDQKRDNSSESPGEMASRSMPTRTNLFNLMGEKAPSWIAASQRTITQSTEARNNILKVIADRYSDAEISDELQELLDAADYHHALIQKATNVLQLCEQTQERYSGRTGQTDRREALR